MSAVFALGWLVSTAAACSSTDGGDGAPGAGADAGPDATVTCEPGETAENGACVAAGLVACPAGTSGADGVCKPTFPASCKAGTAKILGVAACVPVGHAACPAGTSPDASGWGCSFTIPASCTGSTRAAPGVACVGVGTCPSALPSGAVRFVDDDFTAGQIDATHFATIGAALTGAPPGAVLSIAAGTYVENVIVPAGVSLIGTCAADVVIAPAPDSTTAAITASAGTVKLRGLTLRGAVTGLSVKGANVSADALVVEKSRGVGIEMLSGALEVKSSVIRGTTVGPTHSDALGFWGLGGATTLDDVTIEDSAGTGLASWRTSKVLAHGLTIVRTARAPSGSYGWAVDVESGGSFDGTRLFVESAFFAGVSATDAGSHVVLHDSIITGVALGAFGAASGPKLGAGIAASQSAVVEAHQVSIGKTAGSSMIVAGGAKLTADFITAREGGAASDAIGGLYASGATVSLVSSVIVNAVANGLQSLDGATVTLDTVLVRDTKITKDSSSGIGVLASRGKIAGKRVTLERNATVQLAAIEASTLTLESLATLDAQRGPAANFGGTGIGVLADQASKVSLSGAYLGQSELLGISLRRKATLDARGLVIDGVRLVAGGAGYGVHALEGATVSLTDFAVHGANGASLVIAEEGTKGAFVRGTLRDVGPDKSPGLARGASVQAGAVTSFDRVRILGSTGTALYITRAGSSASFTASVIDGVERGSDGRFGDAFEIVAGASLRFDRGVIRNAKGAALVFAGGAGEIDGSLIEHNAVGIHVQDGTEITESDAPPADLTARSVTVTRSTRFEDNATRVGTGLLPLPQPIQ